MNAPSRSLFLLRRFLVFTAATDIIAAFFLLFALNLVVQVSGIPHPLPLLFPRTIAILLLVYGLLQVVAARRLPESGALLGLTILGRFGYFGLTLHAWWVEPSARFFLLFGLTDLAYAGVYLLLVVRSAEIHLSDLLRA